MSKEKQIEEMAQAIFDSGVVIDGFDRAFRSVARKDLPDSRFLKMAAYLHDAGYRKQSEKESKGCEYCKGRAYTKKPLTVITKYGRRIELVFEFCPNCGRKMKGGAE